MVSALAESSIIVHSSSLWPNAEVILLDAGRDVGATSAKNR